MKKSINMLSKNTNSKLTIGLLLDDTLDKPDGVQQYIIAIGEYYKNHGHTVHYLVADTKRHDIENVHSLTNFLSLKFNGNNVRTPLPVSSKKIKSLLSQLKLDVLHVQMPFSPFFARKVIKSVNSDCRVVGTWHTFPSSNFHLFSNWLLSLWIRSTLKKFSFTVGVSEPTARFADKIYGTSSIVIPNAINIDRFNKYMISKTLNKQRILYLGRFVERKGPKHLIEALAKLKNDGYDLDKIEVVMGGKGPDLIECQQLAVKCGLSKVIQFIGYVDENDKPNLLASADIAVFPSTGGEAFGISIVEAMASGSSVVLGGNNQGYASILGQKPELLFNPKNTEEFANKLRHFLDSDTQDIKKWLRGESQKYSQPVVCEKLLDIYR